jgi:helix-turn-helix protein
VRTHRRPSHLPLVYLIFSKAISWGGIVLFIMKKDIKIIEEDLQKFLDKKIESCKLTEEESVALITYLATRTSTYSACFQVNLSETLSAEKMRILRLYILSA